MTSFAQLLGVGLVLAVIQVAASIPWLAVLNIDALRAQRRQPQPGFWLRWLGWGVGAVAAGAILFALLLRSVQVKESLEVYGRVYGTALHIQLAVDFFVVTFALLTVLWPKGAAVAL